MTTSTPSLVAGSVVATVSSVATLGHGQCPVLAQGRWGRGEEDTVGDMDHAIGCLHVCLRHFGDASRIVGDDDILAEPIKITIDPVMILSAGHA